jgi:phage tail P2-like protein
VSPLLLKSGAPMNNSMLPPSASGFMRSTEKVTERLTSIPVDLRKLWNPDECPAELLPYLAWALSVDRWDKSWSERTKRQVIKASWLVHRQKGTIAAIRRAIEPLGYVIKVIEWWEGDDPPGTFRLDIGVLESGITEEMYYEMERLISDAKPVGRHLIGLNIVQEVISDLFIGSACYGGDIVTVYPEMEQFK